MPLAAADAAVVVVADGGVDGVGEAEEFEEAVEDAVYPACAVGDVGWCARVYGEAGRWSVPLSRTFGRTGLSHRSVVPTEREAKWTSSSPGKKRIVVSFGAG